MMILPKILATDDGVDLSEYANFFIDTPGSNNFGMGLEGKVDGTDLPKYSSRELALQDLPTDGRVVDLDLRTYAKKYLIRKDLLEQEAAYLKDQESRSMEGKLGQAEERALRRKKEKHEKPGEFIEEEEKPVVPDGGTKNKSVKHYLVSL